MSQYSIDGSALQYVDNEDVAIPTGKTSTWVPDARFGVYYYTSKFYAGVSVMDLSPFTPTLRAITGKATITPPSAKRSTCM